MMLMVSLLDVVIRQEVTCSIYIYLMRHVYLHNKKMFGYGTRGYVTFDNFMKISKMKKERGFPKLKKLDNVMCKQCKLEK